MGVAKKLDGNLAAGLRDACEKIRFSVMAEQTHLHVRRLEERRVTILMKARGLVKLHRDEKKNK